MKKPLLKRIKSVWLCGLIIMISLSAGCKAEKEIVIDVDALANTLATKIAYKDQMDDDFDAEMIAMVYGIDPSNFVKSHIYLSTGATAEEIAVFEAKDQESADIIYSAMKTRIEDQKMSFVDYVPEEMIKLKDPVYKQQGSYIVLSVSNDSDQAIKLIDEYFK